MNQASRKHDFSNEIFFAYMSKSFSVAKKTAKGMSLLAWKPDLKTISLMNRDILFTFNFPAFGITYQNTVANEERDIFSFRIWRLFVDEPGETNVDVEDHALRGFGVASRGDGEGTFAEFDSHHESEIFGQMLNLKNMFGNVTEETDVAV